MRLYYGADFTEIFIDSTAEILSAAEALVAQHTPLIDISALPIGCKIAARILHGGPHQVGKRLLLGPGISGIGAGDGKEGYSGSDISPSSRSPAPLARHAVFADEHGRKLSNHRAMGALSPSPNYYTKSVRSSVSFPVDAVNTCELLVSKAYQRPSRIVTHRSVLEVILVRFDHANGGAIEMFLREDLESIAGGSGSSGDESMGGEQHVYCSLSDSSGGDKYVWRGASEPLLVSLRNAKAPPSSLSDGNGEYFSKDSIFAKYKTSFSPSMSSVRPSTAAAGRSSLSSPNQYYARGIYGNRDPIGNAQFIHRQREHMMHEDYSPSSVDATTRGEGVGALESGHYYSSSSSPQSRLMNRPMTASAAVGSPDRPTRQQAIAEAPTFSSDFIEDEIARRKLIERNATLKGLLVKSGAIKGSKGEHTVLSAPTVLVDRCECEEEERNDNGNNACGSSDPAVRRLFSGQAASSPQRLRETVRSTRTTCSATNGTSDEDPFANPCDDVPSSNRSSGLTSPSPASIARIRSPPSFTPPPPTASSEAGRTTTTTADWYCNDTNECDEDINTRGFVSVLCEFNPPVITIVGSVPDDVVSDLEEAIFTRCVAPTAQAAYYAEAYGSFGKESRYERYMQGVEEKIARGEDAGGEKTGADANTKTTKANPLSCSDALDSRHAARSGPRAQEYHANSAKRPRFVDVAKERRLRVQQLSLLHHYFNDAQQGMLYVVIMDVMEEAGKRSQRRFEEEEARRRGGGRHSGFLTEAGTPSKEPNNTYMCSQKGQQQQRGAPRMRHVALPIYYKMVPFDGETSVLHSVIKQIERSHRRALKGPQGRFADSELTTLEPYKHSCELLFIPTELRSGDELRS